MKNQKQKQTKAVDIGLRKPEDFNEYKEINIAKSFFKTLIILLIIAALCVFILFQFMFQPGSFFYPS